MFRRDASVLRNTNPTLRLRVSGNVNLAKNEGLAESNPCPSLFLLLGRCGLRRVLLRCSWVL
jgi:hypothetical protein